MNLSNESLFEVFSLFVNRYIKSINREIMMNGIPVKEGRSVPLMFDYSDKKRIVELLAEKCGLKSAFIEKPPSDVHPEAVPFIVFMKDGSSAVLEKSDRAANTFILRNSADETAAFTADELDSKAYGTVLLLKKDIEIKNEKDSSKRNKWFFDAIWLSKWIYLDVIAASFFINLFGVVTPLFTMNVYDRIVPNHAVESLWALASGVFIVFVFDSVLKYLRHHFLEISAKKTDLLLSGRLFRKVMDIRLADRPKVIGSYASNIKEFDMIRNFLSSSTISVFVDLPFMILFLLLIGYIAGIMVLIPIIVNVIILIFAFSVKKPINELVKENYAVSARKNGVLIESLKTIETIKSFNFHRHKIWEWDSVVAKAANLNKHMKGLSYSMNTFFNFMVNLTTVSVIIVGIYKIAELKLTTGGLIAAVMLSSRAVAPLGQAISLITTFDQAKVAYQGIDDIMQKKSETVDADDFINITDFKGSVDFRNVSFRYSEEGAYALKNVSFSVKAGEKVALLGKMGSGKTTLQKLIMGFFQPSEGEALIDGISVSQINPALLRDSIAYVPQNVELFRGTLKQNVCIRKTDATDAELVNAINVAALGGFVNKHPQGIAAEIDEDGHNLSGGQKQSVTIARAFVGKSRIALLDEPTDGIDFNTEGQIITNLREAVKDKTLFLITHKNNLLALVDRVIVLDEGQVVYDGPKGRMFEKFS
jgi:ATP-binding cassette subfamily C protein LapB